MANFFRGFFHLKSREMCEEKEKSKWEIAINNNYIQVGIDWRHLIVSAQWNIGVECEKQSGKALLKSGFRLGFAGTVLNFLQKIKIEMSFVSRRLQSNFRAPKVVVATVKSKAILMMTWKFLHNDDNQCVMMLIVKSIAYAA